MKIIFKITSRSRPDNLFRGIDSIVSNLSNTKDYYLQCTFDSNDLSMNNKNVIDRLHQYDNLVYYFGESYSKIHAINLNIEKLTDDYSILVNFSDDQIFTKFGFDDLIRAGMQENFPDTDGFLHFHDGNQNRLATMSIIGKKWFNRTGYIYHPSYITEWADVEEQERANRLGKYKYMGDDTKIMLHIHPYHGHKVAMDSLYEQRLNKIDKEKDRNNYFNRLLVNFES